MLQFQKGREVTRYVHIMPTKLYLVMLGQKVQHTSISNSRLGGLGSGARRGAPIERGVNTPDGWDVKCTTMAADTPKRNNIQIWRIKQSERDR
jgi:hypothetical protein